MHRCVLQDFYYTLLLRRAVAWRLNSWDDFSVLKKIFSSVMFEKFKK